MSSITKDIVFIVFSTENVLQAVNTVLLNKYDVIATSSGHSAIDILSKGVLPSIFVLDLDLPDMDAYELCTRIQTFPSLKNLPAIFLTAQDDQLPEKKAFFANRADFIRKPAAASVLETRIELQLLLHRHGPADANDIKNLALNGTTLTSVERRVLQGLLSGLSEKRIAAAQGHSYHTTHQYVTAIYRKFGVNSRAALMALWLGQTPQLS